MTERNAILDHMIAAIRGAEVRRRPFRHIYVEEIFPPAVYAQMIELLPPAGCYHPGSARTPPRTDGRDNRVVAPLADVVDRLEPAGRVVWSAVLDALASPGLRDATWSHLGVPARASGHPRPLLVRDDPGYWIEPHPDSRAKRVTMQFYLARDGSHEELGTVLYRLRPFRPSVWLGREGVMEKAGRFPFKPNTGYAFPVRWNSFHGVEPVSRGAGARHTLMNVYYREARPT